MKRSDFRHLDKLRVRWAEVDAQQIVFNAHYLMYLDTAVAGYWRALALPYQEAMDKLAGDLYVRKATLEYEGSARYDDQLTVGMRCARVGNTSLTFAAGVFRGEQLLVHGELVYVFADPATQQPRPVPDALRGLLSDFEAGGGVFEVRRGDWAASGDAARRIRRTVFADEQRIPADLMCDAADAAATHAVALNRLGMAVAAGRLLAPADGIGWIGRMATLSTVRGARVGAAVLGALVQASSERGDRAAMLNAQATAVAFYERNGFVRTGVEFVEAGLPHVEMRRELRSAPQSASSGSA